MHRSRNPLRVQWCPYQHFRNKPLLLPHRVALRRCHRMLYNNGKQGCDNSFGECIHALLVLLVVLGLVAAVQSACCLCKLQSAVQVHLMCLHSAMNCTVDEQGLSYELARHSSPRPE